MPRVTMPDGQVVDMPEKLTPEQATRLKSLQVAAPAAAAAPPEDPTSIGNLAGAAIEPLLAMGSSAALQIPSGLAGVGNLATNALGITHNDPADTVNAIQGAAYQPHSTGGQNAMLALGAIPGAIERGADYVGEKTAEATGSPFAGAALKAGLEGLPQILGMKGAKSLAKTPGVLTPKPLSDEARMLADKGVTMTPGQARGGIINDIEQKLSSFPIIGTAIKNARGKSVEQFSQATINDALKEVGAKLPGDLKGHEAVDAAAQVFSDKYSELLPKLGGSLDLDSRALPAPGAKPVTSLRSELTNLKDMAVKGLPADQAATVVRVIDNDIIGKFTEHGKASGETLQEIREDLRNEIEAHQKSTAPADRKVAMALQVAREAMDDMIERENPTYSSQYKALRKGYATFEVGRVAAGRVGAKEGVATPNQYGSAVRAQDKSKGKRAYSRGTALGQPLARAGRKVLAGDVPDSGTAGRSAMMDLFTAGGVGAAGAMGHPGVIAGAALIPALYSQFGLRALQPFILGEKAVAPGVAGGLTGGAFAAQPGGVDSNGIGQ